LEQNYRLEIYAYLISSVMHFHQVGINLPTIFLTPSSYPSYSVALLYLCFYLKGTTLSRNFSTGQESDRSLPYLIGCTIL
jgi:hypothetical protein